MPERQQRNACRLPKSRDRAVSLPSVHRLASSRPASGFTLIEVLIALVIVSVALLGIAQLIARGQRASFEAYQRQQAVTLANDMAERIRANRMQAAAYAAGAPAGTPVGAGNRFADLLLGAIPNCALVVCTPQQLVVYDLAYWDGLLQGAGERDTATGTLIGGIVHARGCVEVTAPAAPPANLTTYRVSVAWQGESETVAPTATTCADGQYGTANRRRVVTLDLRV
jgi:type IV pilus assembly protein PilV